MNRFKPRFGIMILKRKKQKPFRKMPKEPNDQISTFQARMSIFYIAPYEKFISG